MFKFKLCEFIFKKNCFLETLYFQYSGRYDRRATTESENPITVIKLPVPYVFFVLHRGGHYR
jgi:hypothetical protein